MIVEKVRVGLIFKTKLECFIGETFLNSKVSWRLGISHYVSFNSLVNFQIDDLFTEKVLYKVYKLG